MIEFVNYILEQSAWLYTKIYQNQFFFFDLWSIAHFLSGFTGYLILRALRLKHPLIILLSILFLYELVEILFVYFAFMIFHPETIKDQFTDIFIGISGALGCKLYLASRTALQGKKEIPGRIMLMFTASFAYAYFWVGFYHYHYNVEAYNTPGINWSTALAWTLGGILILMVYSFAPVKNAIVRAGLAWLAHFIVLLVFEYFYYYILEVRETTGLPLKPLIFGVCHGTRKMHIFYIIAPFIIILLYTLGEWLVSRAVPERFPVQIKNSHFQEEILLK